MGCVPQVHLAPTRSTVVAFAKSGSGAEEQELGGRLHRVHLSEGQAVELRAFLFAPMHAVFSVKYLEERG